jgi:hypothetical protein
VGFVPSVLASTARGKLESDAPVIPDMIGPVVAPGDEPPTDEHANVVPMITDPSAIDTALAHRPDPESSEAVIIELAMA